jgi:hypothetical protein
MGAKVMKDRKEQLLPELYQFLANIEGEPYVRHYLCWSITPVNPFEESEQNHLANILYIFNKKMYERYLEEKDYDSILVHLDKQTKMGWFIKNYKKIYRDVGDEKYYKILRQILIYVDNHDHVRKHYSKLISRGNDHLQMMSKKERNQFDKLPKKLTIFRGTSSNKFVTPSNIKKLFGNSWSLDREIPIWFSIKHSPKIRGSKYIILLTYKLKKSEVISYFTQRGENEIFLDYTNIDLKRISYEYIPEDYKLKVKFNKKESTPFE